MNKPSPNRVIVDMLVPRRTVEVTLTRATLRRIEAHMERVNVDQRRCGMTEDELEKIESDEDVIITIGALLDHALEISEHEDGMCSTLDGRLLPYPKWRQRVKRVKRKLITYPIINVRRRIKKLKPGQSY